MEIIYSEPRFAKFAKRLSDACDKHPACPPLHKGRQVWLKDQFAANGMSVTVEGIRKWLGGETRPREDKAEILGRVLDIDPVWLRIGRHVITAGDSENLETANLTAPPLQVGIRQGLAVEIRNLPLNLTKEEASKLANIILAHANDSSIK